jgi:hypothetical protein
MSMAHRLEYSLALKDVCWHSTLGRVLNESKACNDRNHTIWRFRYSGYTSIDELTLILIILHGYCLF